jgi:hypothetical protein
VLILAYDNGLNLTQNNILKIPIHFSQITSLLVEEKLSEISKKKSLLGRAVVGGFLLGGAGAVVAGMSGMGSKKVLHNHVLKITYYESSKEKIDIINLVLPKPKQGHALIKLYEAYLGKGTTSSKKMNSKDFKW